MRGVVTQAPVRKSAVTGQRLDSRAADMRRSGMHPAQMPAGSGGMANSCVTFPTPATATVATSPSAPTPPPAATRLGGAGDHKRSKRNGRRGRDGDDEPPEHERLP